MRGRSSALLQRVLEQSENPLLDCWKLYGSVVLLFTMELKHEENCSCWCCLTVSTSAALAAHKHAMKPKDAAATTSASPMMIGQVCAADKALYMRNKRESGV
jgi:hypothetical protein